MTYEPIEHIAADRDDIEEKLTREYRAGFWAGMVSGVAAGILFAPVVWYGVLWLGA